jgi:phospholipid/cholesterol/gamma-HCH transport system ATP-binding protein
MLDVHGLTGPAEHPFIRDVDLRVAHGDTVVVLGAIHSGKSLLIRHLLGLEAAARGTVAVDGASVDAARATDADWKRVRRRVGVVFESSALLRHITVIENVELPLVEHAGTGPDDARRAARALLHEVGVDVDDDAAPADLTRAEQRHVALARAVALEPRVVLLDEPTAGLDAHASHQLDDAVDRLQAARGFAVVVFSHDVRHAFRPAAEIAVMSDGRIIARGVRDELLASDDPVVHRLMHRRKEP